MNSTSPLHVAAIHTGRAFLPEVPAYESALADAGHRLSVLPSVDDALDDNSVDVLLRFGGLLRKQQDTLPEIHEYHSASTQSMPRLRNVIKSLAGGPTVGRIFLNPFVRSQFCFARRAPHILRDMGAAPELLDARHTSSKTYDLVYAGSIDGREGLIETIERLAGRGLTLGVAGSASDETATFLDGLPNVTFLGRIASAEVGELLGAGRAGLNFTPDRYPLNKQTSTKVIEYLVAGLSVVSNRYAWVAQHAADLGYTPIWLDELLSSTTAPVFGESPLPVEQVEQFLWPQVVEQSGFVDFVHRCASSDQPSVTA